MIRQVSIEEQLFIERDVTLILSSMGYTLKSRVYRMIKDIILLMFIMEDIYYDLYEGMYVDQCYYKIVANKYSIPVSSVRQLMSLNIKKLWTKYATHSRYDIHAKYAIKYGFDIHCMPTRDEFIIKIASVIKSRIDSGEIKLSDTPTIFKEKDDSCDYDKNEVLL